MDRNNLYNRYFRLNEAANLKALIKDINVVLNSNNKNIQVPNTLLKNLSAAVADPRVAKALKKAGVNTQTVQKEVQNVIKNFGGNTQDQSQQQGQQGQQGQQQEQQTQSSSSAPGSAPAPESGSSQQQTQAQAQPQQQAQTQQAQGEASKQDANNAVNNTNNTPNTGKANETQVNALAPSVEKIINNMISKGGAKPTKATLLAVVDRVMKDLRLTEAEAWKAVSTHITREHLL
jgi:hypothetical protein